MHDGTKSVEFLNQAFIVIFGKSFQSLFFLAGWNGSELVEAGETILELCTPASAPGWTTWLDHLVRPPG